MGVITRRTWAIALACALVVGACNASQSPSSSAGASTASQGVGQTASQAPSVGDKTLVVGTTTTASGCDGTTVVTIAIQLSCPQATQETLVAFDWKTNNVTPALATSWDEKPGEITFHLREGVKFTDGTPFNADAVVYNFSRTLDKASPLNTGLTVPYASYVSFKSVKKIDDMTVKVSFDAVPNAIWGYSTWATMIQSPTALKKSGQDYPFHPVGTGPYMVSALEDKVRIELDRNPDYWGSNPEPSKIIILMKSDAQALTNDLLAGDIDALIDTPVQQTDAMKAAGMDVTFFPTLVYTYFPLNTTKAPFDDVRVRQAVNYAFDKEALAAASKGGATAMYSAIIPGMLAFNPDVAQYKFDPVKARQLLDEAGWTLPAGSKVRQKDGQPLAVKFFDRTGRTGTNATQVPIMISNLQDVGFEITSETVDTASYIDKVTGIGDPKRFNIANFGFGSSVPDPQSALTRWTTAAIPPNEFNAAFYSNPAYDDLIKKARTELDPTTRTQLLKDAQKLLREDAPIIWAAVSSTGVARNPAKVDTMSLFPSSNVDLASIKMK